MTTTKKKVNSVEDYDAEQKESNKFVTLFVGILDLPTDKMTYLKAGHNPPGLILPNGKTEFMQIETKLPVGLMEGFPYTDEYITLSSGTKLFCYTDGGVEAENEANELYTDERLKQVLSVNAEDGVKRLVECVVSSVNEHVLSGPVS